MKPLLTVALICCLSVLCHADVTPPREGNVLARQFGVRITLIASSPSVRELPSPQSQPLPEYPREMRLALLQAAVNVRVEVAADGRLAKATVTRNTASGENAKLFAQAVEGAVKKWRFRPAVGSDEKPAAVALDYEVLFTVD